MSTGAELAIRLYDVTAREDSSPVCTDIQPFAAADSLREETQKLLPHCATLEQNFFRLDGSQELFPDSTAGYHWGLWSRSISGEDCRFAEPPILRISFTKSHSSIGLTLRFYEQEQDYCNHLRVRWLDATGNLMMAKDFFPQDAAPFLKQKVEGYHALEVIFLKTAKPCRYLKLAGISYGMELLLGGGEISSAVILEEVDPTCSGVSINTLDITLHSSTAEFSPLNPSGIFSVLQQKQKLSAAAIMDGVRKEMGSFFLHSWEGDEKNNIKLHGVDAVGLMDKVRYHGGIYRDTPVGEVLRGLFSLTGGEFTLDDRLAAQKLSGYLGICTARQALGQISLAIGGIVDCSRSETVHIYPVPNRPSALIGPNRKLGGQKISLRPQVTGIDVTAHGFTATPERYTAFEEPLAPGGYTILFSEPTHALEVSGATVIEAAVNHVKLWVHTAGTVTVTGGRYLHSKQVVANSLSEQVANLADNRLKVENATLVHTGNAGEVLERLRGCCERVLAGELSVRMGEERVADMIMVNGSKGENIKGIVERMETDLTRGCITKISIAAQRIETVSSSYTGELYSGQRWGVL
ncbi:MAG: hypothetical protein RSD07_07140 [Angelakisella sp.]